MLFIQVSFGSKHLQIEHAAGPIEFGRGPEREGVRRVTLDDQYASRDHLRAEELPGERVRLGNLSQRLAITLDDGRQLAAGGTLEIALPFRATLGHTAVTLAARRDAVINDLVLTPPPPPPINPLLTIPPPIAGSGDASRPSGRIGSAIRSVTDGPSVIRSVTELGKAPSADTMVQWMETVLALQRSSASPAELYCQTTQAMIELIGLDVALVLVLHGAKWKVVARSSRPEDDADPRSGRDFSHTVLNQVVAERRTFYQDLSALKAHESLVQISAVVASPIFGLEDDVVGALYGVRRGRQTGQEVKVSPLEAQLVQLLAAAVSANHARMTATRSERDLEIGRDIQIGFLPRTLPQPPGWEIAAHFDPAREVGGDFYDVFALSDDHLAVVIADVCDKGVGAALFMTLFRSLVRAYAQQTQGRGLFGTRGPRGGDAARRRAGLLADVIALSTVELTHNYVVGTHAEAVMFATLFFGVLDVATGALTYVNGGHDAPVLLGAAGPTGRLDPTGPLVGARPDAVFDIGRAQLGPGDVLFAYTDGVTEARDPAGGFFTEKRLLGHLQDPPPSPSNLLARVVARLREHVAGAEPFDDVTMLAIRRAP